MSEVEVVIDEKIKIKDEPPQRYNVIMVNDNFTPVEFVTNILTTIFKHTNERAEYLTMTIHNEGSVVVGTYNYEIAEMKGIETVNKARDAGFPLQVKIEEE